MTSVEVTRAFFAYFKARDLAAIESITADAFVDHDAPPGMTGRGHAYMAAFCRGLWAAFPDLDHEIHDLFGEHDRVCVRFTVRGTHAGPFAGIQPTNRTVAWQIFDIFRVVDGKITDRWGLSDVPSLMRQLA